MSVGVGETMESLEDVTGVCVLLFKMNELVISMSKINKLNWLYFINFGKVMANILYNNRL